MTSDSGARSKPSAERRRAIIDALRRGTVPEHSLDTFAVGLGRFDAALEDELALVQRGGAVFKAVRGEYGSGKTFFARHFEERAKSLGMAACEVQINERETPLHQLETVYRRLTERLSTTSMRTGAFRSIIDQWFYCLEQDVKRERPQLEDDDAALEKSIRDLMERRLFAIQATAPAFAATLRAYRAADMENDTATAEALIAWLGGQPTVGASAKRAAGVKGEVDHFAALSFLQGLLMILRDAGMFGLVLVLDEVETLQRVRSDVRDKGLNALRQLIDEIDGGRFPGLYLMITGTPAFFEGPQGVARLPPLAARLQADFRTDARFDNPRAVQIRLPGFSLESLGAVGRRVRDLYVQGAHEPARVAARADDALIDDLARGVAGAFGGRVGVAPRLFLKKLVEDLLDRIDQFPDFNPREHYAPTVVDAELNDSERAARSLVSPDDVRLDP